VCLLLLATTPAQTPKAEPVAAPAPVAAVASTAGNPADSKPTAASNGSSAVSAATNSTAAADGDKKSGDRKSVLATREDSKASKVDGGKKGKEGEGKKKKDKKEDDARRLADENVDEALEIAELEATKVGDDSKDAFKELYSIFPQSVYTSYDKIKTFAREYVHPSSLLVALINRILRPSGTVWSSVFGTRQL